MAFTQAYKKYLKSKEWQNKRQQCFAYHGKRCKACFTMRGPIQVHHMDYSRLYRESPAHDLIPLCVGCHASVTKIYRSNRRRGLRAVTMEYVKTKNYLVKQRRQT